MCFLRSLLLCIAVAASFRVMKQASTLLFSLFLIYLIIYLILLFIKLFFPHNEPRGTSHDRGGAESSCRQTQLTHLRG